MFYKLAAASSLMAGVYWVQETKIDEGPPPKPYPWTIHVVPHSHDDVGWLVTMNQYFEGSKKDVAWGNVKLELTTVIEALLDNPERKFSEVEMSFFKKWYDLQNDSKK
jgi:hypothetical protein